MIEHFLNYILANIGNNLHIFISVCSVTQYLCSITYLGILCRAIIVNMFLIMIHHNCLDSIFRALRLAINRWILHGNMWSLKHHNLFFHNNFQRFSNVVWLNQCSGCTLCRIHTIYTINTWFEGIFLHTSSNKIEK